MDIIKQEEKQWKQKQQSPDAVRSSDKNKHAMLGVGILRFQLNTSQDSTVKLNVGLAESWWVARDTKTKRVLWISSSFPQIESFRKAEKFKMEEAGRDCQEFRQI